MTLEFMINLIGRCLLDTPLCSIYSANQNPKHHQQADWLINDSWKIPLKVVARPQQHAINRAKVSQLLTFNPDKFNPGL